LLAPPAARPGRPGRPEVAGRTRRPTIRVAFKVPDGGTKAISSVRIKQPKRHAGATFDP
jgi:hypothetical protein